jgi:hypothetical protein
LLINPKDTTAFAARLKHLLCDQQTINQLHSWQSDTVKQYDINVVGPRIVDLYNGQIAPPSKKSNNKAHE